jgi:hypothetical protein
MADLRHEDMRNSTFEHVDLSGSRLRADRMAGVRQVIAELTDDRLADMTEPVPPPGYPPSDSYAVTRCLRAVLGEEWWHHRYAVRDLAVLESRLD